MSYKKWIISDFDEQIVRENAKICNIPLITSILLYVRGVRSPNSINGFLRGYHFSKDKSEKLPDVDKLVSRVRRAISDNEKICIFGDYDADGVTATALVYSYLKNKGANVTYLLPDRKKDGYGLNNDIVRKIHQMGVKLIFTVDNGVSAKNEIAFAKSLGIDTVVTDHHVVPDVLSECCAVVDPYRRDCNMKFKNFSGVGVAFKVISELEDIENTGMLLKKYSDLVAIGTIADSIELVGESRDLVRFGIGQIANSRRNSIKTILNYMKLTPKNVNSTFLMFGLIPRINAAGRLGDATRSVRLLLEENSNSVTKIFESIDCDNEFRKKIEKDIVTEVEKTLENSESCAKYEKILISVGKNWHHGVLGIAASKVTDKYGKPSVLITNEGEFSRASCRSINGVSIHAILAKCSDLFERFGGHVMAAGFTLKSENIKELKKKIRQITDEDDNKIFQIVTIDYSLNIDEVNCDLIDAIRLLEPFGSGNSEPLFGIFFVQLLQIIPIGSGKHLRLIFKQSSHDYNHWSKFETVYFNKTYEKFLYEIGEFLDIAVSLNKNNFSQRNHISIVIKEIKISSLDDEYLIVQKATYEKFKLGKALSESEKNQLKPSRNDFVLVYSYLKKNNESVQRPDIIFFRLQKKLSLCKIYVILDVLQEFRLLQIAWDCDEFIFKIIQNAKKVDLMSSKILNKLKS